MPLFHLVSANSAAVHSQYFPTIQLYGPSVSLSRHPRYRWLQVARSAGQSRLPERCNLKQTLLAFVPETVLAGNVYGHMIAAVSPRGTRSSCRIAGKRRYRACQFPAPSAMMVISVIAAYGLPCLRCSPGQVNRFSNQLLPTAPRALSLIIFALRRACSASIGYADRGWCIYFRLTVMPLAAVDTSTLAPSFARLAGYFRISFAGDNVRLARRRLDDFAVERPRHVRRSR